MIIFSLGMSLGLGPADVARAVPFGDEFVGPNPEEDDVGGVSEPVLLELQASYFDPVILSGPLSFGLSSLPTEVNVFFQFLDVDLPLPEETGTPEILSAQLIFGDGIFITLNPTSPLSLGLNVAGLPLALSYGFNPLLTQTTLNMIVMNSSPQLNITGTDQATNEAFHYRDQNSVLTLSPAPVPEPGTLVLLGTG